MTVVDIPLDELLEYAGRSNYPVDFDGFWTKSVDEIKTVKNDVKLEPVKYPASFVHCFDLYFTGAQKARIHSQLLIPAKPREKCPAILLFHGYGANSGDWYDKLGYVASGFVVAAMDCRGQGGLSEDVGCANQNTLSGHIARGLAGEPENMLFRNIFLDTAQLASIIAKMPETDENNIFTCGSSQGGALAIVCAALEPRISKVFTAYPFLSDYKRILELDIETNAYSELRNYFRVHDPLHENEDKIFNKLGYIDVQNFSPKIKADVLMAITLRDDICPPSTQFAIYNKLKTKKELLLYRDFSHEGLPGLSDHILSFFQVVTE